MSDGIKRPFGAPPPLPPSMAPGTTRIVNHGDNAPVAGETVVRGNGWNDPHILPSQAVASTGSGEWDETRREKLASRLQAITDRLGSADGAQKRAAADAVKRLKVLQAQLLANQVAEHSMSELEAFLSAVDAKDATAASTHAAQLQVLARSDDEVSWALGLKRTVPLLE